MTVGEATIAGAWSGESALVTDLEAVLRDVAVVGAGAGPPLLSIATLDWRQTLSANAAEAWRGSIEAGISDLRGREFGLAAGEEIALDRVDFVARFEDVSAGDWYELTGARDLLGFDTVTPSAPAMRFTAEFGLAGLAFEGPRARAASFGETRLSIDLAHKEQGRWDIGADFSLSEFSANGFEGDGDITVADLDARSQTTDFPLRYWRELSERFGIGVDGGALSEPRTQELAAAIRAERWGSSDSEFTAAGVGFGPAAAPQFVLDQGSLRVGFDGREELITARYALGAEGLFVANSELPRELLPLAASVDVIVEDLPPSAIVVPTVAVMGGQGNGEALVGAVLGEALAGGTPPAVRLDAFHYDSPAVGVAGSGRVAADPETSGGFRGEFDATLRDLAGLEAFVTTAKRDGAAWAQGPLGAECVATLREAGEAVPPQAGDARPVHRYHISVTSDGNAIANGVPWAALMAGCTAPLGDGEWQEQRAAAFEALDAGDSVTAEERLKTALATAERAATGDGPARIDSLIDLGIFYAERGRSGEGVALLEQAVALRERAVGPNHPDLAFTLWWLGRAHAELGRMDAAETHYLRALAIDERALGRGSLDVAWDLDALAVLYRDQSRYAEAEAAFERVMTIAEAKLTEEDADLAQFLADYAALKRATGRAAEAAEMEARAAAIRAR